MIEKFVASFLKTGGGDALLYCIGSLRIIQDVYNSYTFRFIR